MQLLRLLHSSAVMLVNSAVLPYCGHRETLNSFSSRGGRIDPNIDSIDTNVGIGIGSILAW